jgi:hypothetical protein
VKRKDRETAEERELQELINHNIRNDPHVGGYGAIWFLHNYEVVVDMHGRARYECHSCTGPRSVGPWRASREESFNRDWADNDGIDHADGLTVWGHRGPPER